MTGDHDEIRLMLGAYLLGGVTGAERDAVASHLTGCARCRAELAELAPIPGLLRRRQSLPEAGSASGSAAGPAADGGPEPEPTPEPEPLLPRLLEEVAADRRRRRRLAWTRGSAAAAVVLMAGAGAVSIHRATTGGDDLRLDVVAAAGSATHGGVRLQPRAWGTSVSLSLDGMAAARSFQLRVVDRSGHDQTAASWGSTASGSAQITGATSVPLAQIEAVDVVDSAGTVVATAIP